ncbi:MAG: hypothetical protein EOM00_05770 [Clostridia bacterium]|nr:hypothetical protein [Clostridia bacterium]
MDDTQMKLKRHEQWLMTLKILAIVCSVLGIILLYRYITTNGHPGGMAICLLSAVMFFMAYREKSGEPKPGSPEYEAKERAHEAKIKASQERMYRKQHPFMVARELVDENKDAKKPSSTSKARPKTESVKPEDDSKTEA